MAYVDVDFYNEYSGEVTEGLERKLEKASDQIDSLTYNRIVGIGFNNLTQFQQDRIKKAICLHVDFTEQYGEYINSPLSGFSAGSISVSFNSDTVKCINGVNTSSEVYNLLKQTGLTCRRI